MHASNLDKLATYLEALPENYAHFNMGVYLTVRYYSAVAAEWVYAQNPQALIHECGTVACALGHGPAAGVPALATSHLGIEWYDYAILQFVDEESDQFDWLFSGSWGDIDNTPHGAAKRIRYLLADKEIPTDLMQRLSNFDRSLIDLYA